MRSVLQVISPSARRALRAALAARGHDVRELDAADGDAIPFPCDLLIAEVPPGRSGALRCRRLHEAAPATRGLDKPYLLAVVPPGGGRSAVMAGANSFLTGVDGELDARLALIERAIALGRVRTARRRPPRSHAAPLSRFPVVPRTGLEPVLPP